MPPLQSYPIAGIVRDNEKNLISGATVYVIDTTTQEQLPNQFWTTSNSRGEYSLNLQNLSTYSNGDNYEVIFEKIKYKIGKVTGTVVQSGGGDADKDVNLEIEDIGPTVRDILSNAAKNKYLDQEDNETRVMLDMRKAGVKKSVIAQILDQTIFNDVLSTKNSDSIFVNKYSKFAIYFDITKASTPTDITFTPQFSDNDADWYDFKEGVWPIVFTSTLKEILIGDCPGKYIRLNAVATGTDSGKTFSIQAKIVFYN